MVGAHDSIRVKRTTPLYTLRSPCNLFSLEYTHYDDLFLDSVRTNLYYPYTEYDKNLMFGIYRVNINRTSNHCHLLCCARCGRFLMNHSVGQSQNNRDFALVLQHLTETIVLQVP